MSIELTLDERQMSQLRKTGHPHTNGPVIIEMRGDNEKPYKCIMGESGPLTCAR